MKHSLSIINMVSSFKKATGASICLGSVYLFPSLLTGALGSNLPQSIPQSLHGVSTASLFHSTGHSCGGGLKYGMKMVCIRTHLKEKLKPLLAVFTVFR